MTELSKVLLDVETQTNQRPLSYLEDDVEMLILSPSTSCFSELITYQKRKHGDSKKWTCASAPSISKRVETAFGVVCKRSI